MGFYQLRRLAIKLGCMVYWLRRLAISMAWGSWVAWFIGLDAWLLAWHGVVGLHGLSA